MASISSTPGMGVPPSESSVGEGPQQKKIRIEIVEGEVPETIRLAHRPQMIVNIQHLGLAFIHKATGTFYAYDENLGYFVSYAYAERYKGYNAVEPDKFQPAGTEVDSRLPDQFEELPFDLHIPKRFLIKSALGLGPGSWLGTIFPYSRGGITTQTFDKIPEELHDKYAEQFLEQFKAKTSTTPSVKEGTCTRETPEFQIPQKTPPMGPGQQTPATTIGTPTKTRPVPQSYSIPPMGPVISIEPVISKIEAIVVEEIIDSAIVPGIESASDMAANVPIGPEIDTKVLPAPAIVPSGTAISELPMFEEDILGGPIDIGDISSDTNDVVNRYLEICQEGRDAEYAQDDQKYWAEKEKQKELDDIETRRQKEELEIEIRRQEQEKAEKEKLLRTELKMTLGLGQQGLGFVHLPGMKTPPAGSPSSGISRSPKTLAVRGQQRSPAPSILGRTPDMFLSATSSFAQLTGITSALLVGLAPLFLALQVEEYPRLKRVPLNPHLLLLPALVSRNLRSPENHRLR